MHNELTYVVTWPMKIWFYCLNPAQERGETPIADVRKVYLRIDSSIREKFMRTGWMLVRNFGESLKPPLAEIVSDLESVGSGRLLS